MLAAAGALLILLNADWRTDAVAPGPLTVHHAQLVAGENASQRCAACHAAGAATAAQWAAHAAGGPALVPTQTALCMECHARRIVPQWATAAHTMNPAHLAATPLGDPRRDPAEPIACSACHREHQGRLHDLTAIDDASCQACHAQRFDSFAGDHPDFVNWPHRRRTAIAFDHGAHQGKHFPQEKREFACALCHEPDAARQAMLTRGYDVACRECHDAGIRTSVAAGVAVLTVPTLDVETLADAGLTIGDWPEAATGDFDGPLSPAMKLLLAADADGAAALAELGPRFDFYDVEFDDETQLAAASQAIAAYKRTVAKLAAGDATALALFPGLTPAATRAWLQTTFPDAAARTDETPREGARPPNAPRTSTPENERASPPAAHGPIGDWETDDATLALKYAPAGHADALLRTWLDSFAAAATAEHATVADPLLRDLVKPTAPGQCGMCHSLEQLPDGTLAMQWRAAENQPHPPSGASRQAALTRFAHGPHLTQPQLADCDSCHRIVADSEVMTTYAHDDPHAFVAGFESIEKSACAACHRPKAAGEGCTQCHKYHP